MDEISAVSRYLSIFYRSPSHLNFSKVKDELLHPRHGFSKLVACSSFLWKQKQDMLVKLSRAFRSVQDLEAYLSNPLTVLSRRNWS